MPQDTPNDDSVSVDELLEAAYVAGYQSGFDVGRNITYVPTTNKISEHAKLSFHMWENRLRAAAAKHIALYGEDRR